jgi:hypothetical protein
MPTLVGLQLSQFTAKLQRAESPMASRWLTEWELKFVEDIRSKFNTREDAEDLGCPVWNPTSSQWNTLSDIAEKVPQHD